MPEEGITLRDRSHFMTSEEVIEMAKIFVSNGVDKIRITGGEPFIKKDIQNILKQLSELEIQLGITTNAVLLDQHLDFLKSIGLTTLNVSLDTLDRRKFIEMTRRDEFERIYSNIMRALDEEFKIKLNVVLIKGVNDDEIVSFIELSEHPQLEVRFIEFMPFDGNEWDVSKVVSHNEILSKLEGIEPLDEDTKNPISKNYTVIGSSAKFGIISTITNPFCDSCNRIRLTADGKMKNCLFGKEEIDLLKPMRNGLNVSQLIQSALLGKKKQHDGINFHASNTIHEHRTMTAIGG